MINGYNDILFVSLSAVLYKVGPPFYHATYSVVVKTVLEGKAAALQRFDYCYSLVTSC